MKNLIPLSIASIVMAASITVFASDALLSPRASDLRMKPAATADNSPSTMQPHGVVSPRMLDMQMKTVAGAEAGPNTVATPCAIGSPRQLEQAGKFMAGGCCRATSTSCTRPKACCADVRK